MKSIYLFFVILFLSTCQPAEKSASETLPAQTQQPDVEARLTELGIELPEVGAPVANYVPAVRTGNLVFCSGNGPKKPDGTWMTGKLGADITIDEGYEAARLTGIHLLAALKSEIKDLNKVKRIVKVLGMVNAAPDFSEHPKVVNGFSDLMVEVFGEKGKHARAAVGMGSLPFGIPCEIEMIVEVED
jgi:enamine deaminase RidA (YjgF/YER057c/UK114 family)